MCAETAYMSRSEVVHRTHFPDNLAGAWPLRTQCQCSAASWCQARGRVTAAYMNRCINNWQKNQWPHLVPGRR